MTEKKPKVNSEGERDLIRAQEQFDAFNDNVKAMTMDRMNEAPKEETEPQLKKSDRELQAMKDIYLKPTKRIASIDKFNEKFRPEYEFEKEYVQFVAENNELLGSNIEIWTRPFGGMPAEYWEVPTNKPVWGPRYLAEQIKRKCYHRLMMNEQAPRGNDQFAAYQGQMVADTTINRLNARPVSQGKSVFFGAKNF